MARTNHEQLSFAAGEVSPLLRGRLDYQRVQQGLRRCRGFLPMRQGGATRAPGTIFRGRTRNDNKARLIAFQFAADDAVVLEFTYQTMRVWRYGVLVEDPDNPGNPYEMDHPYDNPAIQRLKYVQSADVIYLADGERPIKKLSRFALDDWQIETAKFNLGPFRNENTDEAVTIRASGGAGTVTLTGTGGPFVAGHVGSLMSLRTSFDATIPTWTGNTGISVGDRMRNDGKVYEVVATGGDDPDTGVNPPIHDEGTEKLNQKGPVWKYLCDDTGVVEITGYTNANQVTAEVRRRLPPALVDDPTYRWAEGAWSDLHGYPAALTIHNQRLVAGATPSDPRTLWFSAAGDFADFFPGTLADESFAYAIGGVSSLNRILWIQAGSRALHIGALGEEYSSRVATGESLGATNPNFGTDTTIGSADVQPVAPDGRPIFISRDGTRLFEMRYSFESDAQVPRELSLSADHMGQEVFRSVAWQGAPARLLWAGRGADSDGHESAAVLLYDPNEDVLGWAEYPVAGGAIESICVTPSEDGRRDVVTIAVHRGLQGAEVRYIEEVAEVYGGLTGDPMVCKAVHLFSCKQLQEGVEVQVVDGLDHLEGKEVYAWTSAGSLGPFTVSGGAVDLGYPVDCGCVGLFDSAHVLELLDQTGGLREGGTIGRQKRCSNIGLHLHRTAGGELGITERHFAVENVAADKVPVIRFDTAFDFVNGFTGVTNINAPSGWATEFTVKFKPVGGAPFTLLATNIIMETSGG